MRRRRSKYGVDTTQAGKLARTYDGVTYDSTFEMRYAMRLDLLLKAGEIESWRRQVPTLLHGCRGGLIKRYKCDFLVAYSDGHEEYHETKNPDLARREPWRLTSKLFRDEYPDRILKVVTS